MQSLDFVSEESWALGKPLGLTDTAIPIDIDTPHTDLANDLRSPCARQFPLDGHTARVQRGGLLGAVITGVRPSLHDRMVTKKKTFTFRFFLLFSDSNTLCSSAACGC